MKTDEFRYSKSRLDGNEQQGVIPAASPGSSLWSREQRFHLGPSQIIDRFSVEALAGYGQDTLGQGAVGRLGESYVSKEGVNCS